MWIVIATIVIAAVLFLAKSGRLKGNVAKAAPQAAQEIAVAYQPVDSLITAAEKNYLSVLETVVGSRARIYCMVRVADVLKPNRSLDAKQRHILMRKTTQKHFDFVLCDPVSLQPLCVIELNDRSHQRKDRRERDQFLQEACDSARLPLHFVPVEKHYDANAVASYVDQYLPGLLKEAS